MKQFLPTLPTLPPPTATDLLPTSVDLPISGTSHKWNHATRSLLRLASFTEHHVFKVRPCSIYWYLIPFHGCVIFRNTYKIRSFQHRIKSAQSLPLSLTLESPPRPLRHSLCGVPLIPPSLGPCASSATPFPLPWLDFRPLNTTDQFPPLGLCTRCSRCLGPDCWLQTQALAPFGSATLGKRVSTSDPRLPPRWHGGEPTPWRFTGEACEAPTTGPAVVDSAQCCFLLILVFGCFFKFFSEEI